ncbi:DUF2786 domain-containing protein [Rhodococcus spelaei]|uniref:DUF2786 domain-containing protein n=1 Tax=Rhodococcus spelaei TaxID=2546320 RepID=A0A541BNV5_9NOCA|nr:DUF2786 domain-containing protein [Rhodococcus spelaei]TQF74015.1 DUF2786 domain-containing protein [Rhodococcus spelaei]
MGSIRTHIRQPESSDEQWHALIGALAAAYERGWQPADLVHVASRALDATAVRCAAVTVLHEADLSGAWSRAPQGWLDQLRTIADVHPERNDPAEIGAAECASLTFLWRRLPRWHVLCPPPSAWPTRRAEDPHASATAADPKVLNKIRGLLAKAESTEYTEEAETLTAKAQELMTRYAIGAALLEAATPGSRVVVHSKRIHLDNPYVKQKVLLLTSIGDANQVQTAFTAQLGIATVVGSPVDLEQVEMLFTSLLVQATRAMRTEGEKGSRSTPFRKAFLFGFAVRIGQRLTEAGKAATAQAVVESEVEYRDLLPILANRAEAVQAEVARLFGPMREMTCSAVDAGGWHAGRSAADAATLASDGSAIAG